MCAAPSHRRVLRKSETAGDPAFWLAKTRNEPGRLNRSAKHARKDPSRFAGYVGRVGALAVTLGVGFAVANAAAVARADTDSEATAPSGAESESDSSSADAEESTQQSDDTDGDSSDDGTSELGDDLDGDLEEDLDGDLEEDLDAVDQEAEEPDEPVDTDDEADSDDPDVTSASDDSAAQPPADASAQDPTGGAEEAADEFTAEVTGAPDELEDADENVVVAQALEPNQATEIDLIEADVAATADSVVPMASAASAPQQSAEEVDVIATVVSSVLSPFADPEAPAPTPWFDTLLAWVRRQITHTFFNESPEWGPIEGRQIATGQVLFDLNSWDPNGDPLTYKISQPAHGLVARDPLSGEFIYTPTTVVTGEPLTDSFQVVISDSGEHLKGIAGLIQGVFHFVARAIGLAECDEVALMVNVTVNPIVEVPPVIVVTPAAIGFNGEPIVVSPVLVITDVDSEFLSSATVTIGDPDGGDVLDYDTAQVPGSVTAQLVDGVLSFTGSASVAEYQQLLASVTLTAGSAGVKTVSFAVVDAQGNESVVPAGTVVTVVGVPGAVVAPVVVATPVAAGTVDSAIVVSPIVVITDLDSDSLSSATVTVDDADDVLGYDADLLPGSVVAGLAGGVLTFTGSASVAEYQQLLASVTLTAGSAGVKTVSFAVVDAQGNPSTLAAETLVTVVGVPGAVVAPVVVATPVAAGTVDSAIVVSPIVVITDLDSTQLLAATVSLDQAAALAGDSLGYDADLLPQNVQAGFVDGVLTFTGQATVDEYQQLLASVTITPASAGVKTISFAVVDITGVASTVPTATLVTVLATPTTDVSPVIVASLINVGYSAGSSAVPIDANLIVLDLDSDSLNSATVTVGGIEAGDELDWGPVPQDVVANFVGGVLEFTGTASVAEYQQLLRSVSISTGSGALTAIRTISFRVTDMQNNESVPAVVAVTVTALPAGAAPLVVTSVVNINYSAGGAAVPVDSNLMILDLDSDSLQSATVTVGGYQVGDDLTWGPLPQDVIAQYVGGVLTFTGTASLEEYQQLLRSVSIETSSSALTAVRSISFRVTDLQERQGLPAVVAVTVLSVPQSVPPLVVPTVPAVVYTAGDPAQDVAALLNLVDVDSANLTGATITITGGNLVADETLSFTPQSGIAGEYSDGTLTLNGNATVEQYEAAIRSVTFSTNSSAAATIRTVSIVVTDAQGSTSLPGSVAVTVLAAPVNLAPLVTTSLLGPVYTAGNNPVVVDSLVTIIDLDSTAMKGATVQIAENLTDGDVLDFTIPVGSSITGTYVAATGTLTLSGAGTVAQYREALRSVTFASDGSVPAASRTISFAVTDAQDGTSAAASVTMSVQENAAPLLTPSSLVGTYSRVLSFLQSMPVPLIVDTSSYLQSATLTITDGRPNDTLTVDTTGSIEASYAGGVLSLSGQGTVAEYQSVLSTLRFSEDAGLSLDRFIEIVVTDTQGEQSNTATLTVLISLL